MKLKGILAISAIVLFLGMIIAGIVVYGKYYSEEQSISGYTSLSISNVEVVDSGERIRVYGVANGAEGLKIDWSDDYINQFINDDGYEATKSVNGYITLEEQIKKFYIQKNTDQNFLKVRTDQIGVFSDCEDYTPSGYYYIGRIFSLSTQKSCLYYTPIGSNSVFTNQMVEDSKVYFNIGGATGTLEPSQGSNSITLNDGRTKIEWVGSLNNYNQITAPNQYNVLFHESEFQKLIRNNAYELQQDEWEDFTECISDSNTYYPIFFLPPVSGFLNLKSASTINSCASTFNNNVANYLTDRTNEYENSINAKDVSFGSNSLDVDLKVPSSFPTFTITLDADSVGIIELEGEPDIQNCVDDKTIQSGDIFSTYLTVKNKGDEDGSFYGTVDCGSKASGTISETYVRAGQTVTMPVQITGSNTNDGVEISTCSFKVIDRKSQEYDTCNSQLGVEYQSGIICESGSVSCVNANTLRTCSYDGTDFTDTTCQYGCKAYSDGDDKCKEEIGCYGDDDCNGGEICANGVCIVQQLDCKWYQNYYANDKALFGLISAKQGCRISGGLIFIGVLFVLGLMFVLYLGLKAWVNKAYATQ